MKEGCVGEIYIYMVVDSHTFLKALQAQRAPPTVTTQELEDYNRRARQKLLDTITAMDNELAQLHARQGARERAIQEAIVQKEQSEDDLARVIREKDKVHRVLCRTVQEKSELEAELVQEEQKLSHMRARLTAVGIERERLSKSVASESMLLEDERLRVITIQRDQLANKEASLAREIVDLTESVQKGMELKARRMEQLKSVLAGD